MEALQKAKAFAAGRSNQQRRQTHQGHSSQPANNVPISSQPPRPARKVSPNLTFAHAAGAVNGLTPSDVDAMLYPSNQELERQQAAERTELLRKHAEQRARLEQRAQPTVVQTASIPAVGTLPQLAQTLDLLLRTISTLRDQFPHDGP